MIKRVLIANRGEIAVRIIRACRDLGIETVAVFSEADRSALHVTEADRAVCIGPHLSSDSYLNLPHVISAALSNGCDAIHPGYGFLAENPKFVSICMEHEIAFVGPGPEQMAVMGNKARARDMAMSLSIPVVPGSRGLVSDGSSAIETAAEIGYPVLLKASAGGGGKGMRVVQSADLLENMLNMARNEARSAFGDDSVYMEKYIGRPRHIEVQILRDAHGNTVCLGERDCTVQRRHQKLIEETPSPVVTEEIRRSIFAYATSIADAIDYLGAGTVEFIMDLDDSSAVYFMEMNTRLQVEHPVTEMVCGVDLVAEQLRVASGLPLSFGSDLPAPRGHSFECRINAEDSTQEFRPSSGVVEKLMLPSGPWVRVDTHIYEGYEIPPFYDSLLAKIITWGRDRQEASSRMLRALNEFRLDGLCTTVPFHKRVFSNRTFEKGVFATDFIDRELD